MRVIVQGLPAAHVGKAEAAIRDALRLCRDGDKLSVVATRLPDGEWITYICDSNAYPIADPGLARQLTALMFNPD